LLGGGIARAVAGTPGQAGLLAQAGPLFGGQAAPLAPEHLFFFPPEVWLAAATGVLLLVMLFFGRREIIKLLTRLPYLEWCWQAPDIGGDAVGRIIRALGLKGSRQCPEISMPAIPPQAPKAAAEPPHPAAGMIFKMHRGGRVGGASRIGIGARGGGNADSWFGRIRLPPVYFSINLQSAQVLFDGQNGSQLRQIEADGIKRVLEKELPAAVNILRQITSANNIDLPTQDGAISAELRAHTFHRRLAEVLSGAHVADGKMALIFAWPLISRGPPGLVVRITLAEEILHYLLPSDSRRIHRLIDNYVINHCYHDFMRDLKEASAMCHFKALRWRLILTAKHALLCLKAAMPLLAAEAFVFTTSPRLKDLLRNLLIKIRIAKAPTSPILTDEYMLALLRKCGEGDPAALRELQEINQDIKAALSENTLAPLKPRELTVKERLARVDAEVNQGLAIIDDYAGANRCRNSPEHPCVASCVKGLRGKAGCPVGLDIPAFIQAFLAGDIKGAQRILMRDNPLHRITSRVCPQDEQCQASCLLCKQGAVSIGLLERAGGDIYEQLYGALPLPQNIPRLAPEKDIPVAIVGSGPAGLTCAAELAAKGYTKIYVLEALHSAGGVLRYGIPSFRLPRRLIDEAIDYLKRQGVHIVTNVAVGRTLSLEELQNMGFGAVFLGTGAGLPNFKGIRGEELNGVVSANEFLTRCNLMCAYNEGFDTPVWAGGNVAILGGGNVALDTARWARRLGAKVMIIYRRSRGEMPVRSEELGHALQEGVELRLLEDAKAIIGDDSKVVKLLCQKMELGKKDASGRQAPEAIAGSDFYIEKVDTVIESVSAAPNTILSEQTEGLKVDKRNRLVLVAPEGGQQTTRAGVFAGGDATGGGSVILAMKDGKRAAADMENYLNGLAPQAAALDVDPRLKSYRGWFVIRRQKVLARGLRQDGCPYAIREITFEAPLIAAKAKAGQFMMLMACPEGERIALTIADWDEGKGTVTAVYQEAGVSTYKLGRLRKGDKLFAALGPLGKPSEIPPPPGDDKYVLFACGGLGKAPAYPIIRAYAQKGWKVKVIAGARSNNLVFWKDKICALIGKDNFCLTLDDSRDEKRRLVIQPLKELLDNPQERRKVSHIIAIGPPIMMKVVSEEVAKYEQAPKVTASLPPLMIDGTGMCGVCRVAFKRREGLKYYYETLGADRGASFEAITWMGGKLLAYYQHKLAQAQEAEDKSKKRSAKRMIKKLHDAYSVLAEQEKRAAYDKELQPPTFVCVHGPEYDAARIDFDNLIKRLLVYHDEEQLRLTAYRKGHRRLFWGFKPPCYLRKINPLYPNMIAGLETGSFPISLCAAARAGTFSRLIPWPIIPLFVLLGGGIARALAQPAVQLTGGSNVLVMPDFMWWGVVAAALVFSTFILTVTALSFGRGPGPLSLAFRKNSDVLFENDPAKPNCFSVLSYGKIFFGIIATFVGMAYERGFTPLNTLFALLWVALVAVRNSIGDMLSLKGGIEKVRRRKLANDLLVSGTSLIPIVLSKIYISGGLALLLGAGPAGHLLLDIAVVSIVGGVLNYAQRYVRRYPKKTAFKDFPRSFIMSAGAYALSLLAWLAGLSREVILPTAIFMIIRKFFGEGWAAYVEYKDVRKMAAEIRSSTLWGKLPLAVLAAPWVWVFLAAMLVGSLAGNANVALSPPALGAGEASAVAGTAEQASHLAQAMPTGQPEAGVVGLGIAAALLAAGFAGRMMLRLVMGGVGALASNDERSQRQERNDIAGVGLPAGAHHSPLSRPALNEPLFKPTLTGTFGRHGIRSVID
jgi:glutamate synthase (NADPH/NADH) small chain